MEEKKRNGVYYTPNVLADYLVRPLIIKADQSIMDPSYGEGALLLAAERAYNTLFNKEDCHLYGCDIKPVNGLLNHIPSANLAEIDFFHFPLFNKYDTIVMNPPYVRHHLQDSVLIRKYREVYPELRMLNSRADLWSYFLIKAVLHLKDSGSIGAILPWSFLQADYSAPLRRWLSERFQFIKVESYTQRFFAEAEERILVLWLINNNIKTQSIKIAFTRDLLSKKRFLNVPIKIWKTDRIICNEYSKYLDIYSEYKKFGFRELHNYADIRIGVVTGADKYFIKSREEASELGFKKRDLVPILTRSSEFISYLKSGSRRLKVLLKINESNQDIYKSFIIKGIEQNIHLRAHPKRRTPWYSVKREGIPDAFFLYRASKIPYMVLNTKNIQCTNSIHRIYFRDLSITEMKWVVVSILSAPTQLSIEVNSKSYGGGVLKIEPKALKNALVVIKRDKCIDNTYLEVIQFLIAGNRVEAFKVATDFINRELSLPLILIRDTNSLLEKIHNLRLKKI